MSGQLRRRLVFVAVVGQCQRQTRLEALGFRVSGFRAAALRARALQCLRMSTLHVMGSRCQSTRFLEQGVIRAAKWLSSVEERNLTFGF